MSVRPSIRKEQIDSQWRDFHEISSSGIFFFSKRFREIQVVLKPDSNKVYRAWRPMYIFDYISHSSS